MEVKISNILRNLKGRIGVMNIIYEAITNSFHADADTIRIYFRKKENLDVGLNIVDSFTIEDNGVGFTEDNINSFSEYLTEYKYKLGCKGIGRFTWLKVFENVFVESYFEDKTVSFKFDRYYKKENVIVNEATNKKRSTKITFRNYLNIEKSAIDLDLNKIKENILEHFILMFSIRKHEAKDFIVELINETTNEKVNISLSDVVRTKKIKFSIKGKDKIKEDFSLVYYFLEDSKIANKVSLCANKRVVESILSDYKSLKLPRGATGVFLLFSNYLDERVNEERTDFVLDKSSDFGTIIDPITYNKIIAETKTRIDNLIMKEFPQVQEENKATIAEVINEYPYLKKYFEEDNTVIKRKDKMIKYAESRYKSDKLAVKNEFAKMLERKNIDSKDLNEIFNKLSDISNRELAQYFVYRQQIIDGLKSLDESGKALEELVHNLFMEKGTSSNSESSPYSNNIWLLDDKFMSFQNIFSDIRVKQIVQEITDLSIEGSEERPDMTIFYSNNTIAVVEFKGIGVSKQKKLDALGEVHRNSGIVAKHFDNLSTQFSFIITDFDDGFKEYMDFQPNVFKTFTNSEDPIYYQYNDKIKDKTGNTVPTHLYILSVKTVWKDADIRNKTFMDIIKNTN